MNSIGSLPNTSIRFNDLFLVDKVKIVGLKVAKIAAVCLAITAVAASVWLFAPVAIPAGVSMFTGIIASLAWCGAAFVFKITEVACNKLKQVKEETYYESQLKVANKRINEVIKEALKSGDLVCSKSQNDIKDLTDRLEKFVDPEEKLVEAGSFIDVRIRDNKKINNPQILKEQKMAIIKKANEELKLEKIDGIANKKKVRFDKTVELWNYFQYDCIQCDLFFNKDSMQQVEMILLND